MLHPYELSTGEIVFVECDAEVIDFLVESKRAEENADRRHRYNCPYHIEAVEYEGLEYADPETPEDIITREEESERLAETLKCLTDTQLRRLLLLSEGYTITQIADIENVSKMSVSESIESARLKMQKLL